MYNPISSVEQNLGKLNTNKYVTNEESQWEREYSDYGQHVKSYFKVNVKQNIFLGFKLLLKVRYPISNFLLRVEIKIILNKYVTQTDMKIEDN